MMKLALKELPTSPGVYFFKNARGHMLYVGKAANLRSRVYSYLRTNPAERDGAGLRFPFQPNPNLPLIKQRLIKETSIIDWEETLSEIEALLRESHYIKKYQPRFNVLLRDDKTFLSVKITNEEYPRVITTRKIEKDGTYYGPFTDARAVKETLKILRRFFPYRTTCLPNSGRACLYYHLGLCPGVCIGKMSAQEYQRQIRHLKNFFEGKRKKIISRLKQELKKLRPQDDEQSLRQAEKLEFKIKNLEKVLAMSRVLSFGEKVEGDIIELAKVLNLKEPPHRIEGYDISNIMGVLATASMVVFTDGVTDKNEYRKFKIKTVRGANDVAMLKEVLRRRFSHTILVTQINTPNFAIAKLGVKLHGFTAVASCRTGFRGAEPRTVPLGGTGAWVKNKLTSKKAGKNISSGSAAQGAGQKEWPLPDLVVIDGGRPQLGAAMEVWQEFGLKIPLVSLAKRYEEIFIPNQLNPLVLPRTSPALHLLQAVRDEAHRFAVSYHKLLRRQKLLGKKRPRTRW